MNGQRLLAARSPPWPARGLPGDNRAPGLAGPIGVLIQIYKYKLYQSDVNSPLRPGKHGILHCGD